MSTYPSYSTGTGHYTSTVGSGSTSITYGIGGGGGGTTISSPPTTWSLPAPKIPTEAPSSPSTGDIYVDPLSGNLFIYNGKRWITYNAEPVEPEPLDPDRPMDVELD